METGITKDINLQKQFEEETDKYSLTPNDYGSYYYSDEYVEWLEQNVVKLLTIPAVVGQNKQLKAFAQFLYNKEYLVKRSIDEAINEYEKSL